MHPTSSLAQGVQAQSDIINVQARDELNVISANAHIDWAAAKSISLSTAGGANITIDGGNITVQCPGKIIIHAGKKSFTGPESRNYPMPALPRVPLPAIPPVFDIRIADIPGPTGHPIPHMPWQIVRATSAFDAYTSDVIIVQGETDTAGKVALSGAEEKKLKTAYDQTPSRLWLVYGGQSMEFVMSVAKAGWTEQQKWQHALDAMGYSDQLGALNGETMLASQEQFIRREVGINSGASLLKKLEGKA